MLWVRFGSLTGALAGRVAPGSFLVVAGVPLVVFINGEVAWWRSQQIAEGRRRLRGRVSVGCGRFGSCVCIRLRVSLVGVCIRLAVRVVRGGDCQSAVRTPLRRKSSARLALHCCPVCCPVYSSAS